MTDLHIDIESYSPEPIEHGVYRYAADPEFRILLVGYAWDNDPVQVLDLEGQNELPVWLTAALLNPGVRKHAHNATFERVCFSAYLRREGRLGAGDYLDPSSWCCSMILCARCGLPLSLDKAGAALGLRDQKMKEGKELIKLFCLPHDNEGAALFSHSCRALPEEHPDEWTTFKRYCIRDVEVERGIGQALSWYPVSDFEQELYATDQRINDRGALVDVTLVENAVRMDAIYKARLQREAAALTGLPNPNSVPQLKAWLGERLGESFDTLSKTDVSDLLGQVTDPTVRRVLEIRRENGKTSTQKYPKMLELAGSDGRLRGMTQFYGTRTGRWSGRGVQLQNLPQNHIDTLDSARAMVREGDIDLVELCYGNVPDTLSQLIRTAFIPRPGSIYAVCDFSAIEARVVAWLAGEEWVLDVFRAGGDIYCATASQMFGVPVEKHGQNAHLRQKGKVAVLALGYQGGVGALDAMGGQRMGLTEDEEAEIVDKWRASNPHIVAFWKAVQRAAENVVRTRKEQRVAGRLTFRMHADTMTIELPSGRQICYPGMQAPEGLGQKLSFMGTDQTTGKWQRISTFGGKLTENIVQAVARDCLAEVMVKAEKAGLRPCFHIHDEIVCEVESAADLKRIEALFAQNAGWSEGLPLRGAGYTGKYYFKD